MGEREEVLERLPIGIESPSGLDGGRTLECRRIAEYFDSARRDGARGREEMFRVLRARLMEVARRRMPADDAQDAVQESMLVVIDRMSECETPEALLGLADGILREAINELGRRSPLYREILLRLAEEHSYADLCSALGIPSSIIEKRVFRSRQALRNLIRERLNGDVADVLAGNKDR